uniref:Secreted protein n=1 Tax=Macrostomum lignano TaxID=282301 RepID=A0A1I8FGJ2_9PLAT
MLPFAHRLPPAEQLLGRLLVPDSQPSISWTESPAAAGAYVTVAGVPSACCTGWPNCWQPPVRRVLLYLAAAVSDFYLPCVWQRCSEHKMPILWAGCEPRHRGCHLVAETAGQPWLGRHVPGESR